MDHFNRYSYVYLSAVLTAAAVVYTVARHDVGRGGLATVLILALAIIYFVLARRGHVTPASPLKRIRRSRAGGRPTVVHIFSDFHFGSLIKRPLAAGVERDFRGHCDFIFIDANHREAEQVAEELDAGIGEFVIFDATGKLVEHAGLPSRATLQSLVDQPAPQ